jgi:hypothetical protein
MVAEHLLTGGRHAAARLRPSPQLMHDSDLLHTQVAWPGSLRDPNVTFQPTDSLRDGEGDVCDGGWLAVAVQRHGKKSAFAAALAQTRRPRAAVLLLNAVAHSRQVGLESLGSFGLPQPSPNWVPRMVVISKRWRVCPSETKLRSRPRDGRRDCPRAPPSAARGRPLPRQTAGRSPSWALEGCLAIGFQLREGKRKARRVSLKGER